MHQTQPCSRQYTALAVSTAGPQATATHVTRVLVRRKILKLLKKMLLAEDRLGQVTIVSPYTVVSFRFSLIGLWIKASKNNWQCFKKLQLNMHIHIS